MDAGPVGEVGELGAAGEAVGEDGGVCGGGAEGGQQGGFGDRDRQVVVAAFDPEVAGEPAASAEAGQVGAGAVE